jgi:hypothetical protein
MLLQNTEISVDKTIGQIQSLLTSAGALAILVENDPIKREPVALRFQLRVNDRSVAYELPARANAIFEVLQKRRHWSKKRQAEQRDREQAARIAWRQIFRWTEAQLALVQLQMAEAAEVFLPYALTTSGRTLFFELKEHNLGGLLPAQGHAP